MSDEAASVRPSVTAQSFGMPSLQAAACIFSTSNMGISSLDGSLSVCSGALQVFKGAMDGVHDVAVKVFAAPSSDRDMEVLHTEIAVLRSCNSRNIVQFYGVCFKQDNIWVVMELMEQGSLYNALEKSKRRCLWYHRCPSAGSLVVPVTPSYYTHTTHTSTTPYGSSTMLLARRLLMHVWTRHVSMMPSPML